jgi:Glycosyl hydrolase family 76
MPMRRAWLLVMLTGLALLQVGPAAIAQEPPGEVIAAVHLARAHETRAYTERALQHLSGGPDCLQAVFVSYARSDREPTVSDEWYDVSQIWADLALAQPDEPLTRCWAHRGFVFLDRLWDRTNATGGFFARADLEGEAISGDQKWADDNSLAGIVWLDAARRAPAGLERELLLGRARATARFLMFGGLWDDTFGGGFWWNSAKGTTIEGKPAQTNGLAAEFFLQLYAMTGEVAYRGWANQTLAWLDTTLYDPAAQLYRWSVHFTDLEQRRGEAVSEWFFNYDQGILSEANLLAYRLLGGDRGYYERAWSLARRLDPVFWNQVAGGYNLQAGVEAVYPVYSAWLSQSLLAWYDQDHDPYWLERAAANVDALNRAAWDPAHGGYFHAYYACGAPTAPGCESGAKWVADTSEKHTVDQAWMQRVQALLAATRRTGRVPARMEAEP